MHKTTLDLDALTVESWATTAESPRPVIDAAKASGATSCVNRPPYCTC